MALASAYCLLSFICAKLAIGPDWVQDLRSLGKSAACSPASFADFAAHAVISTTMATVNNARTTVFAVGTRISPPPVNSLVSRERARVATQLGSTWCPAPVLISQGHRLG